MRKQINKTQVLIADSDSSSTLLLQEYFEQLETDDNITCATDGHQAINFFNAQKFDLVILDICLPGLSGLEVLLTIKTLAPHIIVFAYTACIIPSEVAMYYHSGFDEILLKPLDYNTFSGAMKRYFKSGHKVNVLNSNF